MYIIVLVTYLAIFHSAWMIILLNKIVNILVFQRANIKLICAFY